MVLRQVTSRDNPLVKRLRLLSESSRARREAAETLLDGAHLLTAALQAGIELKELVLSEQGLQSAEIAALMERLPDVPATLLPDVLFARVSPVDTPSGLLALIDIPQPAPAALGNTVVVLDGVQDPGNLGTILRTAAAAGVEDVLLTRGCTQAWSPRALRAGMGGHFRLRLREHVEAAEALAGWSGSILATALGRNSQELYALDLKRPTAWLFGAEGSGLSPEVAALATEQVRIPMPGEVESLNVGAAVAVCLFEQLRQRRVG